MSKRILFADDEPAIRAALFRLITDLGYDAVAAADGRQAIVHLTSERFDLCLTDLRMPEQDGFAVIEAARAQVPPVPVMVLTGQGTVHDAVAALRAGACDFLAKPVGLDQLERALRDHFERRRYPTGWQPTDGAALIGEHPAMKLVLERIDQVASADANVLIRGETGTGKEVAARLIHSSSARRTGPFIAVNMAAIPESLAESELLGHERGAFTGADRTRQGKIAAAHGGTLFLDEIGDMPLGLQAKLLRVLSDHQVQPVGSDTTTTVDIRVIAATHRNLEQLVRDGEFRQDLFYRLDVIPIEMPALRDRKEDVPLLIEHFRVEMNVRHGRTVPGFDEDVVERLTAYEWPGNVRQLQNLVERMVVIANNRPIAVTDLPPNLRTNAYDIAGTALDLPEQGVDLRQVLSQIEERLIGQALKRTGGNRNRAAELLGLNRTTLVEKLRRRNVA